MENLQILAYSIHAQQRSFDAQRYLQAIAKKAAIGIDGLNKARKICNFYPVPVQSQQ